MLLVFAVALVQLPVGLLAAAAAWSPAGHSSAAKDLLTLLRDTEVLMSKAHDATLATHALPAGTGSGLGGASLNINTRMVTPKPPPNVTDAHGLQTIYISTNKLSRKYQEIIELRKAFGVARASLLYYDRDGVAYASFRGNLTTCTEEESRKQWWEEGWKPFYPQGPNTSFYTVVRFDVDWLEIVDAGRFVISANRTDWLPVSLSRSPGADGSWSVVVAPAPGPAPTPPPPPTPPGKEKWRCGVCQHVYDPAKDGDGKRFEDLPDSWTCPVCGAAKAAFKKELAADGSARWVHDEDEELFA
eukprot:TRINITY_DN104533_c0_g1_i1.p1 TRINITY_DN104533_c0_g1~~TRINITY_DN104533_c0_g1_i1.p1  ORF type:complete len:301 (+),score=65.90 TRINITY_DN104533_c0_g1_i1:38-940(+)